MAMNPDLLSLPNLLLGLLLIALGAALWRLVMRRRQAADPPSPAPPPSPPAASATFTSGAITAARVINAVGDVTYYEAPLPVAVSNVTLPRRKVFVGRGDWLNRLGQRLAAGDTVGVTSLKGIAGVGKSALALEAAYRFADLFPDGRFWLDLRANDAEQALRALLIEQGVAQPQQLAGGFAVLCGLLRGLLAGRRVLLVLDNAEGIARHNPGQLTEMCLPAPAKTIITSRVMVTSDDLRIDLLSEEDALALLIARGVDAAAQQRDATRLVHRLGRLALAVDITGRRMAISQPAQSCAAALADLEAGAMVLDALRLPLRNNVDDNVAASFALTYSQLDDALRLAYHALGLCAATGVGVAGLAALLEMDASQAREQLRGLAYLSLADFDGNRAELHPLLYEYAGLCIQTDRTQANRLRLKHVAFFGAELGGGYQRAQNDDRDSSAALAEIDLEYDNVLLAQERALAENFADPALAVDLTDDLATYWLLRNQRELSGWLAAAIILARRVGRKVREANCIQSLGDVHVRLAEYGPARQRYEEALPIYRAIGARLGEANCIKRLGDVHVRLAEYGPARQRYEEALPIYRAIGDRLGEANCYLDLGRVTDDGGLMARALTIHREIGSLLSVGRDAFYYGEWLAAHKEIGQAVAMYTLAAETFDAIGLPQYARAARDILAALPRS